MIRAVIAKDILWPQKQEDRDEGGWTSTVNEPASRKKTTCNSQRKMEDNGIWREHTIAADAVRAEDHQAECEKETEQRKSDPDSEVSPPGLVESLIGQSMRERMPMQNDEMV